MMDFKEFTTRAEQDIRAALEDASPGVGVGMNQVEKLQGESYTAITLTPEGTNIGMLCGVIYKEFLRLFLMENKFHITWISS